jgi:hypothetical protein
MSVVRALRVIEMQPVVGRDAGGTVRISDDARGLHDAIFARGDGLMRRPFVGFTVVPTLVRPVSTPGSPRGHRTVAQCLSPELVVFYVFAQCVDGSR